MQVIGVRNISYRDWLRFKQSLGEEEVKLGFRNVVRKDTSDPAS